MMLALYQPFPAQDDTDRSCGDLKGDESEHKVHNADNELYTVYL